MAETPLLAPSLAPVVSPLELSFEATTEQILKRDIPWESYMTAKLINPTDFQLLRRYDHKSREMQAGLLEESGPAYVKTFLSVLRNVFKEETTEYVLAVIHSLLLVNRRRVRFFFEAGMTGSEIFEPLLRLLSSSNWYILEATTKLLSELIAQSGVPNPGRPQRSGRPGNSAACWVRSGGLCALRRSAAPAALPQPGVIPNANAACV